MKSSVGAGMLWVALHAASAEVAAEVVAEVAAEVAAL